MFHDWTEEKMLAAFSISPPLGSRLLLDCRFCTTMMLKLVVLSDVLPQLLDFMMTKHAGEQ